ncbi:MAG: ATP-binding cassette domain-containing protein [Gammaproteobacteria bacterium]|nr:ATP-binding cassette domain-containing protein [Gammaproteobacteria bacterium]
MSEKLVVLENICKSFGDQEVLHDFNLYIDRNEFVTLLGPSGCGKTTLLRMIAGFEQPTSGKIYFDGQVINDLEPNRRPINTVFQRYALFPHLNVYDNVAFGLKNYKVTRDNIKHNIVKDYSKELEELKAQLKDKSLSPEVKEEVKNNIKKLTEEIKTKYEEEFNAEVERRLANIEKEYNEELQKGELDERTLLKIKNEKEKCAKKLKLSKYEIDKEVMYALKLVHLEEYKDRKVDTLSGGQMQRIAMARAIVMKPKLLLLDEPLAALDRKLRQDLQYELKEMQKKLGITFVFVTHDQEEALTMSDTIVVMNEGRILQIGTPEMIYNEPRTRFVANFIGESIILDGVVPSDNTVKFDGATFKTTYKGFSKNEEVDVVLRPEDLLIVPQSEGKLKGKIDSKIFKGEEYEINVITASGQEYSIHTTKDYELGTEVGLTIDPENITLMKKPGVNTFSGAINADGNVEIAEDIALEYGDEEKEELEEGTEVVVRINTADVLLDDIEESDFTGVIKDIKKRDLYYDVYLKVGNLTIVSSTTKVHHVGEETGIWIKKEKVFVKVEESEEEDE